MAYNAVLPNNAIILSTAQGRLAGQTILNTWTHVAQVLSGQPTVGQTYDAMLADWWDAGASVKTTYLACLPSDYTLDYYNVQVIYPTRYKRKQTFDAGVGGLVAPAKESATAQVIYRSGDLGSRKDQSSLHLPGVGDSLIADGVLDAGQITRLNALAVKCKTAYTILGGSITVSPAIFHRGPQPTFSLITDAIAKTEVRTMRRRVVGRGV